MTGPKQSRFRPFMILLVLSMAIAGFLPSRAEAAAGTTGTSITEVTLITTNERGNQGCSHGFYKNHPEAIAAAGFSPETTLFDARLVLARIPGRQFTFVTLQEALQFKGGPGVEGAARILLRQAVAALLNAAHPDVDFPLTPRQVGDRVINAFLTNDRAAILALAEELDRLNNLGCPLSGR